MNEKPTKRQSGRSKKAILLSRWDEVEKLLTDGEFKKDIHRLLFEKDMSLRHFERTLKDIALSKAPSANTAPEAVQNEPKPEAPMTFSSWTGKSLGKEDLI